MKTFWAPCLQEPELSNGEGWRAGEEVEMVVHQLLCSDQLFISPEFALQIPPTLSPFSWWQVLMMVIAVASQKSPG